MPRFFLPRASSFGARHSSLPFLLLCWCFSCAGGGASPDDAPGGSGGDPIASGSSAGLPGSGGNGGTRSGGGTTSGGAAHDGGAPASNGGSLGAGGNGAMSTGGGASGGSTGTGAQGGLDGSGGTLGAGGTGPDTDPLLQSFDAYFDFESVQDGSVAARVGDETLTLQQAGVATSTYGSYLELSGAPSAATSQGPIIDTSLDFSISAWVMLSALGGFNTFVAIDGAAVSAVYLQKRDNDRLSFATFPEDSTAASACVTSGEIQPRKDEWYHVAITREQTTREQRIYVDGVLSGKSTCPGAVFQALGPISVGRGRYDAEPSDFVDGGVDDLGVVARVLSPEEVFTLYRAGRPQANHYLFAYFVEVDQGRGDGLRLAHSHDGLTWGAIGASKVFMPPSVGGGSFRDPHVMRGPDGIYHLVWTTTCVPWAEPGCVQDRGLGHASSPDLVSWSPADYITIDLNVEHVWAPETFFDQTTQQYMVFWSSPVDSDPSAADPHSIYYLLTSDFREVSDTRVLYGPTSRNVIDATIQHLEDGYLMILKDEADGQKNLRALRSPALFGDDAWTSSPSEPLTGNYAAEGPSLLSRGGKLFIYFDKYGEGAYGALEATADANLDEPGAWRDISDAVFFPGVRHGTPIEVPWETYRAVALAAGD